MYQTPSFPNRLLSSAERGARPEQYRSEPAVVYLSKTTLLHRILVAPLCSPSVNQPARGGGIMCQTLHRWTARSCSALSPSTYLLPTKRSSNRGTCLEETDTLRASCNAQGKVNDAQTLRCEWRLSCGAVVEKCLSSVGTLQGFDPQRTIIATILSSLSSPASVTHLRL